MALYALIVGFTKIVEMYQVEKRKVSDWSSENNGTQALNYATVAKINWTKCLYQSVSVIAPCPEPQR